MRVCCLREGGWPLTDRAFRLYIRYRQSEAAMRATITDLRYRMADVLRALERNERVTVTYRGKVKGVIVPPGEEASFDMEAHPFFGMEKDAQESVEETMARLRGGRYDAL